MAKGRPILRDNGMLLVFVAAMVLLPASGLYIAGWLMWTAIYADWITIAGWLR